jgi:hypothetical protein
MWLFTKDRFFSAVCARMGDGRHGQPPDPKRMMVRTRVRGHLEALKHRFPALLGECDVKEFAGTDYAYRIFVDKDVWREVVAASVDEVDYDNFKSEVAGIRAAQERPTRGRCTRFGK